LRFSQVRRFFSARRLVVGTAVLASLAGGIAVASPSWASTQAVYAALGDSYASGVGTGKHDLGGDTCERSSQSAAALWAAGHPGTSFSFVACSGATTTDVLNSQLGALSHATTQVTITIGGNDIGFAPVLRTCVTDTDAACTAAVQQAKGDVTGVLPGRLAATYAAIRARAPRARLIVLGYPRLFELTPSCDASGLDLYKRGLINDGADTLDEVIKTQAVAARATFVDVRPDFSGHGVCSDSPFINGITSPITDSFHPSAVGYASGYLPALLKVTDICPWWDRHGWGGKADTGRCGARSAA
jgi:lysophospholipase L1-like esterase